MFKLIKKQKRQFIEACEVTDLAHSSTHTFYPHQEHKTQILNLEMH